MQEVSADTEQVGNALQRDREHLAENKFTFGLLMAKINHLVLAISHLIPLFCGLYEYIIKAHIINRLWPAASIKPIENSCRYSCIAKSWSSHLNSCIYQFEFALPNVILFYTIGMRLATDDNYPAI